MRIVMLAFSNIEYTIELTEALSELEDVILMLPDKQAKRFDDVINPNVNLSTFPYSRIRNPKNILMVYELVRNIGEFKPDIIHIQNGHPWFNFSLPFLRQYCIIRTVHDVILHTGDKESRTIPKFTDKLAVKYADQIIVHGEELKREMMREYSKRADEINVLCRGINSIYRRYMEEKIEEEDQTVLFFGRIWEYKGLIYLIEAEPRITKEIQNLKIIIAGRGEDVNKLYGDKMINKDKYIIHNSHISNKMVAELFQKASVVVLPYTDASQSGVVPLAYAFGKPVVVTNVGSLPEVVEDGETGYIVPPRDTKKLGDAIIDLLKDKEKRKRMGQKAYKKGEEGLSWGQIALKTMEVYKKAISLRDINK